MLALAKGYPPERRLHHPGVDRVRENVVNLLSPHLALAITGKLRDGLEMALHFRLTCELPAGEALHRILNDRGKGLVADDDLAAILALDEFIANRNDEGMVSPLHAGLHFLNRLTLVLYALQLALRGDHGFNELAFRRVLEPEVEALGLRAILCKARTQANVKLRIPREALEIIEDYDVVGFLVFAQVIKQRDHAAPLHEIAPGALHIREDPLDYVSLRGGVLTAAVFLAPAPIAVFVLCRAGNAGIEKRLLFFLVFRLCHLHSSFCFTAEALLNVLDCFSICRSCAGKLPENSASDSNSAEILASSGIASCTAFTPKPKSTNVRQMKSRVRRNSVACSSVMSEPSSKARYFASSNGGSSPSPFKCVSLLLPSSSYMRAL
ncbi:MAG: hypothetical protein WDO68_22235 [Gammaproteobacteria bacterium]